MRNEKYTRGPAISDGLEAPSDQAELVIILRNAGGEQVIWRREDNHTDPNDDHADVGDAWLIRLLDWGVGGCSTA